MERLLISLERHPTATARYYTTVPNVRDLFQLLHCNSRTLSRFNINLFVVMLLFFPLCFSTPSHPASCRTMPTVTATRRETATPKTPDSTVPRLWWCPQTGRCMWPISETFASEPFNATNRRPVCLWTRLWTRLCFVQNRCSIDVDRVYQIKYMTE